MANRPDVLKDWASNPTALIGEPPSAYALEGMKHREFLVADYLNWILNNQAAWYAYLNSLPAGMLPASAYDGLEVSGGSTPGVFSVDGGTFLHSSGVKVEVTAEADFNLASPASAPGAGTYRIDYVVARYNGATNVTTLHVIESPAAPLSTDLVLAIVRATGAVYAVDRIWRTARLGQPSHRITVGDGRHGNGNAALRLSGSIQEAIDLCSSLGGGVVELSGDDHGLQTESIYLRSNVVLDGSSLNQLRSDPPISTVTAAVRVHGGITSWANIDAATHSMIEPTTDFSLYGIGSTIVIGSGLNPGEYKIRNISTTTNPNDTAELATMNYDTPALVNESGVLAVCVISRAGVRNLEVSLESASVSANILYATYCDDLIVDRVRPMNIAGVSALYTNSMVFHTWVRRLTMTRCYDGVSFVNSVLATATTTYSDWIVDGCRFTGNVNIAGSASYGQWGFNQVGGTLTLPTGFQTWDLYAQDANLRDVYPRHIYQDDNEKIVQGTGNDCESYFDGTNLLQTLPNGAQKIIGGDLAVGDYAGGGGHGDIIANLGSAANNSTRGFVYLPTVVSKPIGVPVGHGTRVPEVVDETDRYRWIYLNDGVGTGWRGRPIVPLFSSAKVDGGTTITLVSGAETTIVFDNTISDYFGLVAFLAPLVWTWTAPRNTRVQVNLAAQASCADGIIDIELRLYLNGVNIKSAREIAAAGLGETKHLGFTRSLDVTTGQVIHATITATRLGGANPITVDSVNGETFIQIWEIGKET